MAQATFYIIAFLLLSYCSTEHISYEIDSEWWFRDVNGSEFLRATVPGCVHLDLMENQIIPDPYYRDNSNNISWIETKDWLYKTVFNVSEEVLSSSNVEIVFEWLDTHAEVYLNQELILLANNAFRTWRIDVKSLLKAENNVMTITFRSAWNYDNKKKDEMLPLVVPTDISSRLPYSRKPRYHYGWDWGPRIMQSGIGKPVRIEAWNTAILRNIMVDLVSLDESQAVLELTVEAEIMTNLNPSLKVDVYEDEFPVSSNEVADLSENILTKEITKMLVSKKVSVVVPSPKLWWTYALGEPFLYDLNITINSDEGILDSKKLQYGIRTIEVVQASDPDGNGKSFTVRLNGNDLFIMGSNYIPADMFMTRVTEKTYENILNTAIEANHNMIRLWGGGWYESEEFYNLCDRKGLLIYHDFMFACEMYPGTPDFMDNLKEEITEQVKRLNHHASIALWNGNNEIRTAWFDWGFQADLNETGRTIVWQWYLDIFEDLIPGIVQAYDRNRFYWPSSPEYGYGHPESTRYGDSHNWNVWAGRADIFTYEKFGARFMAEYGMQGILDMNSILKFTLPEDRDYNSSVMKTHQKHALGYPNILMYIKDNFPVPDKFDDYQYVSQLMQAYAISIAINAHRRSKPYCMGTLYWQLNDVWPVTSWSSVDYYGVWKALHFKSRKMYAQVYIAFNQPNMTSPSALDNVLVHVISENLEPTRIRFTLNLREFSGASKKYTLTETNLTLDSLSNKQVYNFNITQQMKESNLSCNVSSCFLDATAVSDEGSGERWENIHFFTRPKALNLLRSKSLKYSIKNINSKSPKIILKSEVLLYGVYIYLEGYGKLKLSDNYFDLVPGRVKTVTILEFDDSADLSTEVRFKFLNDFY